ncbi:MAG TPA: hypothetical protein VIO59_00600 [Rhodanobacter sp.]
MIILSWNLQQITREKAEAFSTQIGTVVNGVIGDKPFVLIVYENKSLPEAVLDAIGTGIMAAALSKKHVSTGGAKRVQENILLIAGNGATVDHPEPFLAWRQEFDRRIAAMKSRQVDAVREDVNRLKEARPARTSTETARNDQITKTEHAKSKPAEDFRDPAVIIARCGPQTVRMLALHAPGPSAGNEHEHPFAHTFAESVFGEANGFDLILGDFNLRTHEVRSNSYVDQSVQLGATTKGREDGRHTFSRLDRVYARPGYSISTALVSDGQEKDLTDHHCLAIKKEERSQRQIRDYFPRKPSPIRQQEIVFDNFELAFTARKKRTREDSGQEDDEVAPTAKRPKHSEQDPG